MCQNTKVLGQVQCTTSKIELNFEGFGFTGMTLTWNAALLQLCIGLYLFTVGIFASRVIHLQSRVTLTGQTRRDARTYGALSCRQIHLTGTLLYFCLLYSRSASSICPVCNVTNTHLIVYWLERLLYRTRCS